MHATPLDVSSKVTVFDAIQFAAKSREELINLILGHIDEGLLLLNATALDVSSNVAVLDAIQFAAKSRELMNLILGHIEEGLLLPNATALDVSSKVTVLDATEFAAKSWSQVQASTITRCFRKAGIQRQGTNKLLSEEREEEDTIDSEDSLLIIQQQSDDKCRGGEAYEDDIIEAVRGKKRPRLEDNAAESCAAVNSDDGDELADALTVAEAKRPFTVLCRFSNVNGL
jgi:hypothetical protein